METKEFYKRINTEDRNSFVVVDYFDQDEKSVWLKISSDSGYMKAILSKEQAKELISALHAIIGE